jgi:hypothetical protein
MENSLARNTFALQEDFRGTNLPMSLPMHIKSPQIQRRFDEDLHRYMHVTLKQGASIEKRNIWLIQKLQVTELQFLDKPFSPPFLRLANFLSFSIRILSLQSQNKYNIHSKQKMKLSFDLTFSDMFGLAEQWRCNECNNPHAVTWGKNAFRSLKNSS